MNAKKIFDDYFRSSCNFYFENTVEKITEGLNVDFLELLSIDRVELSSFTEVKEFGQLHYCNFTSPFFCVTNLPINKKDVHIVKHANSFLHPIIFHIVSLVFANDEDEIMILFAFTEKRTEILYDVREKSISLKKLTKIA